MPELEQLCRIDTVQLMNRDSTNINSRDWLRMAACVRGHYDAYDGFVLTHGTDTMAYTAAALSYLIQNNAKPVVITGSQIDLQPGHRCAREPARRLSLACDDGACGVRRFDHKVIHGTRARKMRTKS
ncbi:MAG: asparaginase domain-containing protein [Oscillospiraceae bacterium]